MYRQFKFIKVILFFLFSQNCHQHLSLAVDLSAVTQVTQVTQVSQVSQKSLEEKLEEEIAFSPQWQNLYYYKKKETVEDGDNVDGTSGEIRKISYESRVANHEFFFSNEGKTNPLAELRAALEYFKNNNGKWKDTQLTPACAFPARYEVIKKYFPSSVATLTPAEDCVDLKEWISAIPIKEVYLVFASVYPNNPASIFGHTFLRFAGREGESILNYSVGFFADIGAAEADNAFLYTYNGLMGGYLGYFYLKPFYESMIPYNNSEGRDLYEYKIELLPAEINLLQLHLWEMSRGMGMPYYFFDENCAYYLLLLLDVARPAWKLHEDFLLFVPPNQTVLLLHQKKALSFNRILPSIKRKLNYKLNLMDINQQFSFFKSKYSLKHTQKLDDPLVLDALIDYWSWYNYLKKTKLSANDRAKRDASLVKRSQLTTAKLSTISNSETGDWFAQTTGPLEAAHGSNKLSTGFLYEKSDSRGVSEFHLMAQFGHHNINDNHVGFDNLNYAHIDYLLFDFKIKRSQIKDQESPKNRDGIERQYENGKNNHQDKLTLDKWMILDILSLTPSGLMGLNPSWKTQFTYYHDSVEAFHEKSFQAIAGIGLAFANFQRSLLFFSLINLKTYAFFLEDQIYSFRDLSISDLQYRIPFELEIGGKWTVEKFSLYLNYTENILTNLKGNNFVSQINFYPSQYSHFWIKWSSKKYAMLGYSWSGL